MSDERWLRLDGLVGDMTVGELGSGATRPMLHIEDSPGLGTLDLSELRGPLDLLVGSSARPELVLLPKCGAFLHLRLAEGELPDIRFHGPVRGCLIERGYGAESPDRYEAYVLRDSVGLVMQSGDAVHPFPGIARHVRTDQSERGLQIKDLRRGVDHQNVLWRLDATASPASCPATRLLWLAGSPGMLESAVLQPDSLGQGAFRAWLEDLATRPPVNHPNLLGRLHVDALDLLVRLARLGTVALDALWVLRCAIQMARLGIDFPESPKAMLEAASPDWSDDFAFWRNRSGLPDADLDLFAACCHLGETRPFARRLGELEHLSQLRSLVQAAGRQKAGTRARAVLVRCAIRGVDSLRRRASADRRRDPRWHGDEWSLPRHEAEILASMPDELARLGHGTLIDQFIVLAEEVLPVSKQLECGIALHRHGWPQGRRLVARCLESDQRLSEQTRRRAMECLLSPMPERNGAVDRQRIEFKREESLA